LALRNILCSIELSKVICKVSDFGLSKIIPEEYNYYVSDEKKQGIENRNPVKVSFSLFFHQV